MATISFRSLLVLLLAVGPSLSVSAESSPSLDRNTGSYLHIDARQRHQLVKRVPQRLSGPGSYVKGSGVAGRETGVPLDQCILRSGQTASDGQKCKQTSDSRGKDKPNNAKLQSDIANYQGQKAKGSSGSNNNNKGSTGGNRNNGGKGPRMMA